MEEIVVVEEEEGEDEIKEILTTLMVHIEVVLMGFFLDLIEDI